MAYMGNRMPSMFGGDMVNAGPTLTTGGGGVPQAPSVPNIGAPTSVISGGGGTGGAQQGQDGNWYVRDNSRGSTGWRQVSAPALTPQTTAGGGGAAGPVTMPLGQPMGGGGGAPSLVQNPFQQAALNSTMAAGNASAGEGQANLGQANLMRMLASQGAGAAGQVLNTGFDPQDALYNRTAQRLQDQVRVGQAARGITMSPYGAGVENQAMSDFNIDWADRALGRQTQALDAFGQASQGAGGAGTSAYNVGQGGIGQIAAQGQLPYEQSQLNQQNDINHWLAIIQAGQQNYPLTLEQRSYERAGGVPFIPQSTNQFNF